MQNLIIINDKKTDKISVLDHGLLYGDGVFDTFRVFKGKPFRIKEHLSRLYFSAQGVDLKIPVLKKILETKITKALKKFNKKNVFVRIIVTRGSGEQGLVTKCKPNLIIIISQRSFKPLRRISLIISKIRRVDNNAINSKIKSLNYENLVLAKLEAKKLGKDDAILLDNKKLVAEATTSNIFIVKKGRIFTPSLKSPVLDGITRRVILENFKVIEKNISVQELLSADEVFITGTTNFITSVKSVNQRNFKNFDQARIIFKKIMGKTE